MSYVIEIKGTIGFHLHLIVNWTTILYQAQNYQGTRELIFPISSIILEIDNKGKPLFVCNRERYNMTNEQFNQIIKILSAQRSIISDTLKKDCFLPPKQQISSCANQKGGDKMEATITYEGKKYTKKEIEKMAKDIGKAAEMDIGVDYKGNKSSKSNSGKIDMNPAAIRKWNRD
ncbi:MAG: hypothetical protein KKD18_06110 [Nanoarchaeota archaeon]|nr:hypothetical protein [Nanoarchaeota archaeon]